MDQAPQLVGGKAKRQKTEKKENESKIVMEEVSMMDMETQKPIEETVYQDDIKDISNYQKIELGKKSIKQNISDKQRATLAKARAVLAEKRRLEKKIKPAGTPAPDILSKVQNVLESKFSDVNARLDNLQKIIAYEDPLQVNHEVKYNDIKKIESIDNNTFVNQVQDTQTKKAIFNLHKFIPTTENRKEISKVQQISDAMKSIPFTSEEMLNRIKNDFTSTSKSNSNNIFMF